MRLTHEESRLFATLWLKAGDDAVLQLEDATGVAQFALAAIEMGPTPCARERLQPFEIEPGKPIREPIEGHSSWVH